MKSLPTVITFVLLLSFHGFVALGQVTVPEELVSYPEVVFYNGVVLTVDTDEGEFTIAQAVAVRDSRIFALGSNDQILRLAGPPTRRLDLEGKALMPGIVDTHLHPNRYAVTNYFNELPREYQQMLRSDGRIGELRDDRTQTLAEVRRIVERHDPGKEWVLIEGWHLVHENNPDSLSITRYDLDRVCPDKPLYISGGAWGGLVNTRALEYLLELHGDNIPGLVKDRLGVPTGQLLSGTAAAFILRSDIVPRPPAAVLSPLFGKELLRWASVGTTTISTRLEANHIRAYALLDVRGELPLRIAYGHESGRWNPIFQRDLNRNVAAVTGYGSDMLWMNAVTVAPPDGSTATSICTTHERRNLDTVPVDSRGRGPGDEFLPPEGLCRWDRPGDMTRDSIRLLVQEGFRIANIHTYGDKGNLEAVRLFEELGVTPDQRFGLDHTAWFNEELIRKAGEMGIYWSVAMGKFRGDFPQMSHVFGLEAAHRWAFPLPELIEAGSKITYESSARRQMENHPFTDMQALVTRTDRDGNVWGARHALDRETVLRMWTRWGAEYVLREDVLGTIEPGKFADLIIVDRNPLDPAIPDERLSEFRVLMTMVGGKVIYTAPGFTM